MPEERQPAREPTRSMPRMKGRIFTPEVTKILRFMLDECLPPVIRDRRWFFGPLIRIWNKSIDWDFKSKAPSMTDEEFNEAYKNLLPIRERESTIKVMEFVVANLRGHTVLEVGCGNGDLSIACARRGHEVLATDLLEDSLSRVRKKAQDANVPLRTEIADIQRLPYPDKSFDTTICANTLEHVRDVCASIAGLKRVTSNRLIIVVPKQRYFRYTPDYHLSFFGGPEQLTLAMGIRKAECQVIDRFLCYTGDLD